MANGQEGKSKFGKFQGVCMVEPKVGGKEPAGGPKFKKILIKVRPKSRARLKPFEGRWVSVELDYPVNKLKNKIVDPQVIHALFGQVQIENFTLDLAKNVAYNQ